MALPQLLTQKFSVLLTASTLGLSIVALELPAQAASIIADTSNTISSRFNLSDRAALDNAGVSFVEVGDTRIYTGTRQVSTNNQDPFVVSFTGDTQNWLQTYDDSPIDSDGVGLLWDGSGSL